MQLVGLEHEFVFVGCPGVLVDVGIEVVVPSHWKQSYLYRHCLPVLVSMPYFSDIFSLISAQLRVPYLRTSALMALSS